MPDTKPQAVRPEHLAGLQAQLDAMKAQMGYVEPPAKSPRERLEDAAAKVQAYRTETHGGRATELLAVALIDVIAVLTEGFADNEEPSDAPEPDTVAVEDSQHDDG